MPCALAALTALATLGQVPSAPATPPGAAAAALARPTLTSEVIAAPLRLRPKAAAFSDGARLFVVYAVEREIFVAFFDGAWKSERVWEFGDGEYESVAGLATAEGPEIAYGYGLGDGPRRGVRYAHQRGREWAFEEVWTPSHQLAGSPLTERRPEGVVLLALPDGGRAIAFLADSVSPWLAAGPSAPGARELKLARRGPGAGKPPWTIRDLGFAASRPDDDPPLSAAVGPDGRLAILFFGPDGKREWSASIDAAGRLLDTTLLSGIRRVELLGGGGRPPLLLYRLTDADGRLTRSLRLAPLAGFEPGAGISVNEDVYEVRGLLLGDGSVVVALKRLGPPELGHGFSLAWHPPGGAPPWLEPKAWSFERVGRGAILPTLAERRAPDGGLVVDVVYTEVEEIPGGLLFSLCHTAMAWPVAARR